MLPGERRPMEHEQAGGSVGQRKQVRRPGGLMESAGLLSGPIRAGAAVGYPRAIGLTRPTALVFCRPIEGWLRARTLSAGVAFPWLARS